MKALTDDLIENDEKVASSKKTYTAQEKSAKTIPFGDTHSYIAQ